MRQARRPASKAPKPIPATDNKVLVEHHHPLTLIAFRLTPLASALQSQLLHFRTCLQILMED